MSACLSQNSGSDGGIKFHHYYGSSSHQSSDDCWHHRMIRPICAHALADMLQVRYSRKLLFACVTQMLSPTRDYDKIANSLIAATCASRLDVDLENRPGRLLYVQKLVMCTQTLHFVTSARLTIMNMTMCGFVPPLVPFTAADTPPTVAASRTTSASMFDFSSLPALTSGCTRASTRVNANQTAVIK